MKKWLAILLIVALTLAMPLFTFAEGEDRPTFDDPPQNPLVGDWYAEYSGLVLTLSVKEDGTYAVSLPSGVLLAEGPWTSEGGTLALDGGEELLLLDDTLAWESAGLFFRREKPVTYVPAELVADAPLSIFTGPWLAVYADVEGMTVSAAALEEDTVLYVEDTKVALGGELFGNVILDMTFSNGALTYEAEGLTVVLAAQADGFLRLTVTAGGQTFTLYLLPTLVEGLSPAPEA